MEDIPRKAFWDYVVAIKLAVWVLKHVPTAAGVNSQCFKRLGSIQLVALFSY